MYCETHDGNFWIAPDPEHEGLVIAAGDCGHGFKFAPVLGEIIADAVEGRPNPILEKFRWRPEVPWATAPTLRVSWGTMTKQRDNGSHTLRDDVRCELGPRGC